MKYFQMTALAATLSLAAFVTPASAGGVVERACLKSERPGASRGLCACIQDVAEVTLNRGEQKMVASFFKDPQRAQDVRMSKKDNHNDFWGKYKNFGDTAAAYCAVAR